MIETRTKQMLNTPREMADALLFEYGYTFEEAVKALFTSVKDGSYQNVPASYWAAVVVELSKTAKGV
jgi:hypothetical protein